MALHLSESEDLRVVLLGNSGVGKSATANAVLGREAFRETETTECEIQRGRVDSRNISVIDTPGLNTTTLSTDQLKTEIEKCLSLSAPGPHVFLLVIRLRRFTEDERNTVKWIQENMGEEALRFTMVLFTGKEEMTNTQLKTFFEKINIQDFNRQFGGGYSVINSKREVRPAHITKLLEKIDDMVKQNRGQHYTNAIHSVIQTRKVEEATRHGEEEKKIEREVLKQRQEREKQEQERKRREESKQRERQEEEVQKQEEGISSETSQESQNNTAAEEKWMKAGPTTLATTESQKEISEERLQKTHSIEITSPDGEKRTEDEVVKEQSKEKKLELKDYPCKANRGKDRDRCAREDLRRQEESRRERERMKWELERETTRETDTVSDVRIVLVGRSGTGKSATGNTILGRGAFGKDLIDLPWSAIMCRRQDGMVGNKSVTVIDTKCKRLLHPFLLQPADLIPSQREQCIQLCSPGPHVFLLVIHSPNIQKAYETFSPLQAHFGDEFLKRSIVLITHGDKWGRVERKDLTYSLGQFVDSCGGSYHIFNNEDQDDRSQVTELLEKIETLVQMNEGQHYTNEMYQEAQRKRNEEWGCSVS